MSFHRLLPSISFLKSDRRVVAGSPHPLGATWDGRGTNFALFSSSAEKVELCLFDRAGRNEIERIFLPERTEDVWHGYVPHVQPGQLYGYRVHGPYDPEAGHRFNPAKLLIDPYSKRLGGQFAWTDAHLAYRVGNKREDLSLDRRDNARSMLKSVVIDQAYTSSDDRIPQVPWEDTIIYEAHVKGLTQTREDIPKELRGTYRGLAAPAMIEHLQKLGVTAIELLPIHSFLDERHLLEHGLKNYWGYNTLSFFAPERRYAAENVAHELRSTVAVLHSAGIEVILDVVYNHTAEGNHLGPTLCYRGIDNSSYYWLVPDTPRYYENYTGTGNALKLAHPRVMQMVMDSLRYWVEVFHIDGFRFDLASTLGRTPAFDRNAAFFAAVRQDPVLANVKLIAEPWDIGLGGYQVGGFPTGWSEWNDVYRKIFRQYWRSEGNPLGDLAGALTGSAAQFRHDGRGPQASVNHVTVHDGFTLADLVSYEHKHNEANGEDNRDGSDDNNSLNCGAEGPTEDAAILKRRRLLRRNQLASLLLAHGVPLILAGDEAGNSQGGNNNAYCQDDEIGWVNWSGLGKDDDMTAFVGGMARLRQRFPQLRSRHWLEGRKADGTHDVLWLTPQATEMNEEDWKFPEGRFLAYVLAATEDGGEPLFIVFNAAADGIEVTLPAWPNVTRWTCILDTVNNSVLAETTNDPPGAKLTAPAMSNSGLRRQTMIEANRFGPLVNGDNVLFRLWAPGANRVDLVTDKSHEMRHADGGWFSVIMPGARPGTRYRFRIDDEIDVPDPASRFQPEDVHGPSEVVDPAYEWKTHAWAGRPWHESIFLELHVGTFTRQGTFQSAIEKLDHIAKAGFTAIELMPVADFPGRWNWGYDGVLLFAPDGTYGQPNDLKALIDAAHQRGLMVFLDVVYNHFGPDGNYLGRYAPQFFAPADTPWGNAIDYQRPEVRRFAVENAIYWLDDFRFDGLRLDAVHAITEPGRTILLRELSAAVGTLAAETARHIHLVLENDANQTSLLDPVTDPSRGKYRAQWNDDYHHAFHVLLTGETEGYYGDYRVSPQHLARTLAQGFAYQGEPSPHRQGEMRGEPTTALPATAFVNFLQNHDQIGNRALGERLTALAPAAALEAALAVTLLAPSPPLMFMGDEWGAQEPFPFFCDFKGELADAIRNGRRREFAEAYARNQDDVPDPLSEQTLRQATIDWTAIHKPEHGARLDLVQRLLTARTAHVVPRLPQLVPGHGRAEFIEGLLVARWTFNDGEALSLLANLSDTAAPRPEAFKPGEPIWGGVLPAQLPPWSVHAAIEAA